MADHTEQAPGKLGDRLRASLSGHHPLFDVEDIRAALAADREEPFDPAHAVPVGDALVVLAREGFSVARSRIDALAPDAREQLIRLYFQLLARAREVRTVLH
jgi:hypothetical protein